MSHKDAPPLTAEQERMETFYRANMPKGAVGWGRAKDGSYLAEFARLAWKAWQAASTRNAGTH